MAGVLASGKRKLQAFLEGVQSAIGGKRRRLERLDADGDDPSVVSEVPLPWLILVRGPGRDAFVPCLAPPDLACFEATRRDLRQLVLHCGGWEACAERALPPGPLSGHLRRQKRGLARLKAMVAASRSGILRPSLEDRSLAACLLRRSSGPFGKSGGLGSSWLRCPLRSAPRLEGSPLQPVDWTSRFRLSVTSLCFGQEHRRRSYILLVVAFEEGDAFVMRCHRTPIERAMLSPDDVALNACTGFRTLLGTLSFLTLHSAICGHSKSITSMFFNRSEDHLITASLDRRLCVWGISSGSTYSPLLAVFTDSSPLLTAVPMPLCEEAFVAANTSGVLRAVSMRGGARMQRFRLNSSVEALRFDKSGLNVLAGSKGGGLHAFVASKGGQLEHRFGKRLDHGGITCIAFAPAAASRPPRFLVGTAEATVVIADCVYGKGASEGHLVGLEIRRKVKISPPSPLRACCFSSANGGHLICGSADGSVCACPMDDRPVERLREHGAPISSLAINAQDTMLVSADVRGKVVIWRRLVHFPK